MAGGDDRALLDGPRGGVLRAAAALTTLAVGVALAGAFLLPRLRADTTARQPEPRPALLEPREQVDDARCPSGHDRRV